MLKIYFPIDHKIFTSCWLLAVFRLHHILSYFQNKKYAFRTQIKGAVELVHCIPIYSLTSLLMRGLLRHNAFTSTIWKKSHSSPLTRHLAPTRKLVLDGFASSAPISPPWWPTSLHTRVVRPGFLRGQETVKRRGAQKGKEVSSTWVAPFKISLL